MTTAPQNLLDARSLLLAHLPIHPLAVGIVGDPAHRGGYHCGADRVTSSDYSVRESTRDRNGLTDYASALDVGTFKVTINGRLHTLRTFSAWLVAQCRAGAPDTADIREVIYTVDGSTVRRWDRLGIRSSGDRSHLTHTHISYFRDATRAGRDLARLFRRYLTEIGRIPAPAPEVDDMYDTNARNVDWATTNRTLALLTNAPEARFEINGVPRREPNMVHAELSAIRAELAELRQVAAPELDYDRLAEALLRRMAPR